MPNSALDLVPARPTLPKLREAAADCRACPLWENATQTVFGAGRRSSVAMFVGEQPGDREDREGAPFVGPAGRILDDALDLAGIDRRAAYVTNAVKHFKWEPRGKRRIHAKPSWSELTACRPWLEAELAVVRPRVLVCLGATAAQALLGLPGARRRRPPRRATKISTERSRDRALANAEFRSSASETEGLAS